MPEGLPCSTFYNIFDSLLIYYKFNSEFLNLSFDIMVNKLPTKTVLNEAEDPKHFPMGISEFMSIAYIFVRLKFKLVYFLKTPILNTIL